MVLKIGCLQFEQLPFVNIISTHQLNNVTTAQKYLTQASIDPKKDLIPIIPAAHYHMGGIKVDLDGKTSVSGLWACGECSSTGAHGANRLASNSLLEAFVYAKRIANKINSEPPKQSHKIIDLENYIRKEKTISKIRAKKYIWQLRSAMHKFVGVERNYANLNQAFVEFFRIEREAESLSAKLKDMLMVSKLITFAAMKRNESRGTHFRSDYPKKYDNEAKRNVFQLKDLNDYINQAFKKATLVNGLYFVMIFFILFKISCCLAASISFLFANFEISFSIFFQKTLPPFGLLS